MSTPPEHPRDSLPVRQPKRLPFKACASCKHWLPPYEREEPAGWCEHPKPAELKAFSGFRQNSSIGLLTEAASSCSGFEKLTA